MTASEGLVTAAAPPAATFSVPTATTAPRSNPAPDGILATGKASALTLKRSALTISPAVEPTIDDVRRRAYEIYMARGMSHGGAMSDWLQAERQLREEMHDHNVWWAGR